MLGNLKFIKKAGYLPNIPKGFDMPKNPNCFESRECDSPNKIKIQFVISSAKFAKKKMGENPSEN